MFSNHGYYDKDRYSGSSRESGHSTGSSFFGNIIGAIKDFPQAVKSFLVIEDVATCCRCCKGPLHCLGDEFCSQECGLHYWDNLRQRRGKMSGNWMCSMPGCSKLCWVESNGRVHDYCSKTHAEEHRMMKTSPQQQQKSRRDASKSGSSSHTYPMASGNHSVVTGKQTSSGPIHFYDKYAPFYEFTNFYPVQIILDGKTWPTTEHYFQAQKFVGTPHLDMIHKCSSPREAFDYSRKPSVSCWCRKDWDEVKIDIMKKALLAKFGQNKDLRKMLVSTGKRKLVERSPYDSFWGDGGDGTGKNWLGKLLMEIRDSYIQAN